MGFQWYALNFRSTGIFSLTILACSDSSRRSWFPQFRAALGATKSLEETEKLLKIKVERWRGTRTKNLRPTVGGEEDNDECNDDGESDKQARPGSAEDFIDLSLLN